MYNGCENVLYCHLFVPLNENIGQSLRGRPFLPDIRTVKMFSTGRLFSHHEPCEITASQPMVQQVTTPPKPVPGVIHRPQVQLIQNNVVTLSNVQSPADISSQSHSNASPHPIQHSPQSKSGSVSSSKHIPPTLQAVNNRGVYKYTMDY